MVVYLRFQLYVPMALMIIIQCSFSYRRGSSSRSREERRVRMPQLSLEDIERYQRLKEMKESKRPKRERSKDKKRKSKDKDKDKVFIIYPVRFQTFYIFVKNLQTKGILH